MEPRGGPGSGALRECCSQRSGAGTRRGCGLRGGFLSFSLFFKEDCVTVVHLYAARTPFSEERLVIQERKGVRAGAEFANGKENVIRSTGRGMGVNREDWMVGLAGGNVGSTGKLSGKSRVWSEEDRRP